MSVESISVRLLIGMGLLAFLVASLSILDMFRPHPYDGVVLEADAPGQLIVAEVVPGSGAAVAGVRQGDRIVGIGRHLLKTTQHAAAVLQEYEIGEVVPYLIESRTRRRELGVELGPRRIGSVAYLGAGALGFAFFLVGSFVLRQKPRLRAAQVFYLLCTLFLLFLVCRLRPASYSGVDSWVLQTGTLALLFLPGTFLHFFLIFPRPVWSQSGWLRGLEASRPRRVALLTVLYLIPAASYWLVLSFLHTTDRPLQLISGAPRVNWWILGLYMLLGLTALAASARRLRRPNERRGAILVLLGALFGAVPFLVFTVAFPSFRHTEKFLYYGVAPLGLVPLTFAYAIIRFQLLDIRVILRRSLVYTLVTATITAIYAAGIALFNWLMQGAGLSQHPYFPIVFALAIVLGLEPLRRRLQGPVDRFFTGDLGRLRDTIVDLGEAMAQHTDPALLVRDLVGTLPQRLGLHFAALYRAEGTRLERVAGPESLPQILGDHHAIADFLRREGSLVRLQGTTPPGGDLTELVSELENDGVELLGELASPRRWLGVILLSGKTNQLAWDPQELEVLRGLLAQAAVGLETGILLEEKTLQAELERELEIAANIQSSLLPTRVDFAPGWDVAVACQPARHVGGDFLSELPAPHNGSKALVYGDVAGKSVPAALMMMAAQEVLHSVALTHREPDRLLELANRRLYQLGRRSFVSLGYLASRPDGGGLRYVLAGQPGLLRRSSGGEVIELPLSEHRLPLGALSEGAYRARDIDIVDGDLVLGYSDGVLDARSPSGEFFGSDRLAALLATTSPHPERAVQQILYELERFTAGSEPYDDVTLVAIARRREAAT